MSLAELRALAAESPDGARQKVWTEPAPAAGADFTIKAPGPQFWLPVALTATFMTSDADVDRQPVLAVTDGTSIVAKVSTIDPIPASLTVEYTFLRSYPVLAQNDLGTLQVSPLPDVVLPTGWTIGFLTAGIDDADQWSDISVTVIQITGGQPAQAGRRETAILEHWQALHELIEGR